MKFIKTLLASVAFIVAASSANAASTPTTITDLGDEALISVGALATGLNAYTAVVKNVGEFDHSFKFVLGTDSNLSTTLNNVVVQFPAIGSIPGFDVYDIDSLVYSLVSGNTVLASATAGVGSFFTVNNLAAGTYSLNVTGVTTGAAGGTYSFGINVAAVPEPSSVAMLLIGFAALGAVARRRKTL